jgi:hypothetical protein
LGGYSFFQLVIRDYGFDTHMIAPGNSKHIGFRISDRHCDSADPLASQICGDELFAVPHIQRNSITGTYSRRLKAARQQASLGSDLSIRVLAITKDYRTSSLEVGSFKSR